MLKRQGAWSTKNRAPLVKQIIEKTLGNAAGWKPNALDSPAVSVQDSSQVGEGNFSASGFRISSGAAITLPPVSDTESLAVGTAEGGNSVEEANDQKGDSDDGILVGGENTASDAATPVTALPPAAIPEAQVQSVEESSTTKVSSKMKNKAPR